MVVKLATRLPDALRRSTRLPVGGGTTAATKVAVTVVLADKVIVHDSVPEHPPPDQLLNVEPEAGEAVKVIVPEEDVCAQAEPQEMDPPVIVPVPVPDFVTVRVYVVAVGGGGGRSVTAEALSITEGGLPFPT